MAINQKDLAEVREAVLTTKNPDAFQDVTKDFTRIILFNPRKKDHPLEYIDSVKIPEEYQKEFKYPTYVSYHSTLYGVLHNEYGVVVKQIKRSYGELMWKEIISKHPEQDYCKELTESLFISNNDTYHLDWYKVSEGYNLDGLPSSCMKGYGDRFIPLDNLAEMAILVKDSTNQIVARCIVWNNGVVEKANGEKIDKDLYDRLYYVDGYAEELMIEHLRNKGIEPLTKWWEGTFEMRIKNPFTNGYYPWMDTFNILRENDYLYCYDWQNDGYSSQDITSLAINYPTMNIVGALLSQDGSMIYPYDEDENDENYSGYEERYIPISRQVYSDYMGDILTDTMSFQSSYDNDWYPINGKGDIWLPIYPNPENEPDYVVGVNHPDFYYWTDRHTNERYLIPRDDAVTDYITGLKIPRNRVIYLPSRDLHFSKDTDLEAVTAAFTNTNGECSLTIEELTSFLEEKSNG